MKLNLVLAFALGCHGLSPSAMAQPLRADVFTDFEAGANGAVITAALLNTGTRGSGGSWSVTQGSPARLFITNAYETALPCGVQVGATFYGDTTATRTFACNVSAKQHYVSYRLATRQPRISMGFYFRMSAFPGRYNSYDFAVFEGGGEFQVFNYDDAGDGGVFRNHTQLGATPVTDSTSNTTYWVTMLWDKNAGAAGESLLLVYDARTWQLLGSNVMLHTSRQDVEDLHFGRFDNHTNEDDAGTWVYFDDLVIDQTGSVFPLLPSCARNTAPGISSIPDQTVGRNAVAGPIAFAVSDSETAASNLVVTVNASNPILLPPGSLVVSGHGSSRTLTATPAPGLSGTAILTLTVTDGTFSATNSFLLTVRPITDPDSYLLAEGFDAPGFDHAGWRSTGAPNADYTSLVLDGVQSLRCVGAQSIARDFAAPSAFHFYGQVRWNAWADFHDVFRWEDAAGQRAAAVSAAQGRLQLSHGATTAVGLTAITTNVTYHLWVDWTAASQADGAMQLYLSTNATKPAVAEAAIRSGDGQSVTSLKLGPGVAGPDVLFDRLLASASGLGDQPGTDAAPTLSRLPDQVIAQDTTTGELPFIVGARETPAARLVLSATSSNPALVPGAGLVLGGAESNRTLRLVPTPGQVGSATITLRVSDGGQFATTHFTLTVTATNPAASGAAVDAFAPVVNGSVSAALVQSDGAIVLGGQFQSVNGSARARLARLRSDGLLDPNFNPGAFEPAAPSAAVVSALAAQPDGDLLVGGRFAILGALARASLARLKPDGAVDETFDPAPGGEVNAIAVQPDGKIIVGGSFESLAGRPRPNLGRLHPDGSLDTAFTPDLPGVVHRLLPGADGAWIVAGNISHADGLPVSNVVRLLPNGRLDRTFVVGADGLVAALAQQADGRILVGGQFTNLNGQARARLGRLLPDGTLDPAFVANSTGPVGALCVQADGRIVVGGAFNLVAGINWKNLARLNRDGSPDLRFDCDANLPVSVIVEQAGAKLLVGGSFSTLDGEPRTGLGRLYPDGSVETALAPGADAPATTVAVQPDGRTLVGGEFSVVRGSPRSRVARLLPDGTVDRDFDPVVDGVVEALAVQPNGRILLAGAFTSFDGAEARYVGRLGQSGFIDTSLNARPNAPCRALALQPDGRCLVAGDFSVMDGRVQPFLARLRVNGSLDQTFLPDVDGPVATLALQPDGRVLLGGRFTRLNGRTQGLLGRLHADGTPDLTFNPSLGGTDGTFASPGVSAVCVQPDGRILVGGLFTTIDGKPRPFLARLCPDGRLDASFDPALTLRSSFTVRSIALQADGGIVVAGDDSDPASPRTTLLRLHADGGVDAWSEEGARDGSPLTASGIRGAMLQADGKVFVAGNFAALGSQARTHLGRWVHPGFSEQTLSINAAGTVITWTRGGTAPEIEQVTFERSFDGTNYSLLGAGRRIAGGWELAGQALPIARSLLLRAHGRVVGGRANGSSGLVEQTVDFYLANTTRLTHGVRLGDGSFQFTFTPVRDGVFTVMATTNLALARPAWQSLGTPTPLGNGAYQFTDRSATNQPQRFYQVRGP